MQSRLDTIKGNRDPFFDNARFVLVALVVLGHLVSPFRDQNELIFFANNFLASFRMPALILLTGYFSKRFYKDRNKFTKQVFFSMLIPYIIFQCLYSWLDGTVVGWDGFFANLFFPNYGMWFLLSLFTWNILLFFFTKLEHPILISFFLAIGIGWIDGAGEFFSISRTFVFFPLFLIGHYVSTKHLEWFKKGKAKVLALISIVISWLILFSFPLYDARDQLLAKYPYAETADSVFEGPAMRLIFYAVMFLGIFSCMPWMPQKQTFFTYLGRRTAYVYILHLCFMEIFYGLDLFSRELDLWLLLVIPAVWLSIVFFVSSNQVVFLTRPLVEGRIVICLLEENSLRLKVFNKLFKAS